MMYGSCVECIGWCMTCLVPDLSFSHLSALSVKKDHVEGWFLGMMGF